MNMSCKHRRCDLKYVLAALLLWFGNAVSLPKSLQTSLTATPGRY